nr:monothiol glutaredoxin-S1-like [Tanacetum cinerariifolium]
MGTVKRLVVDHPLVIFSRTTCSISYSLKTLLRNFRVNPEVYELDEILARPQVEGELLGLGCDPSVPVVYIGKKLVGGANEVKSLNMRSGLKPLLIEAKTKWL